jgi:hypothetical protein
MSYIITAEVRSDDEMNLHGDRARVAARILSDRGGTITFDTPGKFGEEAVRVQALCASLVAAGFYAFRIGHSY